MRVRVPETEPSMYEPIRGNLAESMASGGIYHDQGSRYGPPQPPQQQVAWGANQTAFQQNAQMNAQVAAMDQIPQGVAGTNAMAALEGMENANSTELDLSEYGVVMGPSSPQHSGGHQSSGHPVLASGRPSGGGVSQLSTNPLVQELSLPSDQCTGFSSCNDTPFYLIAVAIFVLAAAVLLTFKLRE